MNTSTRRLSASILAITVTFGLAVVPSTEAYAVGSGYPIAFTGGRGAYPRSEPAYAARTGTARPEGTVIPPRCWTNGDTVPPNSYGYTSDIWIQDDEDGTYWPEAWLDTHADGIPPGLPNCSELSQPSVTTPNLFYNRRGAADWALANAPYDPAASYFGVSTCTWFVSNALWAGGFPRDAIWTDQGEHNRVRKVPGSVTAWSVVDLKQYLETHYSLTEVALGADRLRANAVPEAEIGDLIVYDWGEGEGWSHFTIVTNIAPGEYPEVSEWGVDAGYTKRGWTYSENKDRYLQWVHPNVKAVLLHIDGGVLLPGF